MESLTIQQIIILGFLVEAVWETGKLVWQKNKVSIDAIGAIIIGLIIAFTVGADILLLSGFNENIPFVGIILTGILISRGGNAIHDLLTSLGSITTNLKGGK